MLLEALTKGCPVTGINGDATGRCPLNHARLPVKLNNLTSGRNYYDTLHHKSEPIQCRDNHCKGALMAGQSEGRPATKPRSKLEIVEQARSFLEQYYLSQKKHKPEELFNRLNEIEDEVDRTGTYVLGKAELHFGAKMAWRNATRCIGRIQWKNLELQDSRHVTTAEEMFEAMCHHLEYATNAGNLRSMITVFPPRQEGRGDFRVWNPQMISYAGYLQPDGSVIGDPLKVQFTRVCQRLGWKGSGGKFDILPWVLEAPGESPKVFDIPSDLVLRVKLEHPRFPWFAEMGLEWYAVPAVSDMLFDVGGIEYPAAPFNGWYMGTEVGARDLCDSQRYNIIEDVAKRMNLDTSSPTTLWKDQVLVEVNVAVLYSYQKNRVTIVDHHTAAETFMKHMETEQKQRGGCPADWVWIVPPMSASVTPVYHQEMIAYNLKPSYEYQEKAWKVYQWKRSSNKQLKYKFSTVAKAAMFASSLMASVRSKRIRATVLYATETGKSETFAQRTGELLHNSFNTRVICMDDYNIEELIEESMVVVVASTFGSGDAPDNGKDFWKQLNRLRQSRVVSLKHIQYAVFALGSSQYPTFCMFGKSVDEAFRDMGAKRLLQCGLGDDLRGQDQTFIHWVQEMYKNSCEAYEMAVDQTATIVTMESLSTWDAANFRLKAVDAKEPDTCVEFSKMHHRNVQPCKVLSCARLQACYSEKQTLLVRLDTHGHEDLKYLPGDHMGIFPCNPTHIVEELLKHLKDGGHTDFDTLYGVETLKGGEWQPTSRLPACSVRNALTRYLDITTPPSPHLLSLIAEMVNNNWDKLRLKKLAEDIDDYEEWKQTHFPNLAEVVRQFRSLRLTPDFIMTQLPLLQPRYYSISSSSSVVPNEVHLTMAVVTYKTQEGKGVTHLGVCTSYIEGFPTSEIPCFTKSAPSFHLPRDRKWPLIMVGAGSGIAPFRSFWQQREQDLKIERENGGDLSSFGKMILFFGCRTSKIDNIYAQETAPLQRKGVLSHVFHAFSRENGKKTYVQHVLKEQRALVYATLSKEMGHMYVCGDAIMAGDVRQSLKEVFEQAGNMSHAEAEDMFQKMMDEDRYHEDVFGILHFRPKAF